MNRKNLLVESAFTLLGLCLLLVSGYMLYSFHGSIPDEPPEQLSESVESILFEGKRSNQWQSVRNEFVKLHPRCEACGSNFELNVHHITPFHEKPELELDMENLITLCREHHFRIGHDPDGPWGWKRPSWLLSNPNVKQDAEKWMEAYTKSRR